MEHKVVLHVMGMDSSKYGGIEHFNVELSKTLCEKGYKAVFIYEEEPQSQDFIDGICNVGGEIVVLNSRRNFVRFCRDFIKLLKKYQPILVHAHFTKACFYAIPIAYFMGIRRLFITIHSTMVPKIEIKPHTRFWYHWIHKKVKVVAVSDDILSVYKANWPDAKVRRIYLGVGQIQGERVEGRKVLGIPQGQIVLLTVANFNHVKGLDVLCKAVGILKNEGKMNNVCLYIVGQPESDKAELQGLIASLGIEEYVRMEGISNLVPYYMLAADVYIQSSRHEGLPLALMEAASAGLPLVGTRVGGIPEIVRDGFNGVLTESENSGMLADSIVKIMNDSEMNVEYGRNSKEVYFADFSIDSGVNQTIQYYGL